MLGTKLYKEELNLEKYGECASWCNENNATIVDNGEYFEVVTLPDEHEESQIPDISERVTVLEDALNALMEGGL
ncbi:hypothetical protein [Megasphaera massiliensis]|jgi:hypothetical protein|uniref:hypothetical protein n=1 Tax=Megasphaera massiliensis TaxID=1232428 RepID=UPI00204FF22C|nr:hypothetical protein [uncultured Megasphaera sp.]DAH87833.1 MAG TPA: hypothetical protein [Bacteriophage sp.]